MLIKPITECFQGRTADQVNACCSIVLRFLGRRSAFEYGMENLFLKLGLM